MDLLQWNQLAAALANVSKRYSPPGSSQAQFADSMLQSAQSNIINENQKKAQKEKEKKEKGGLGGTLGSVLGTAVGGTIGGPFGAAIGGALGNAGGTAAGGGSIDPAAMLMSGIAGYGAGKSMGPMPAQPGASPDVFNLLNREPGSNGPPVNIKDTPFKKAAAAGLVANAASNLDPFGLRQSYTAPMVGTKAEAAQRGPMNSTPFDQRQSQQQQGQGFFRRMGNNLQTSWMAHTNPTGLLGAQAYSAGPAVPQTYAPTQGVPFGNVQRGRLMPHPARGGVYIYEPQGY